MPAETTEPDIPDSMCTGSPPTVKEASFGREKSSSRTKSSLRRHFRRGRQRLGRLRNALQIVYPISSGTGKVGLASANFCHLAARAMLSNNKDEHSAANFSGGRPRDGFTRKVKLLRRLSPQTSNQKASYIHLAALITLTMKTADPVSSVQL